MRSQTATETLIAREYLRVSKDRSKREKSVKEQHTENARAAEENGWTLGKAYEDNDMSASRYATKTRDDYARLVADLRADRFGADVLILWEPSRGSRRMSEWATLLDLLDDRGVRVHVTSHHRTYDPSEPRDRRSLNDDGSDAEYESGKTSLRMRRAAAAAAAEGRPNGKIPFGYLRRYNERTRELIAQEPDPATAPLVRELFERVHRGHSLRSIQRDWAGRGIVNGSGRPFSSQHLRALLLTRAYVGERVHTPRAKNGNAARHAPQTVTTGLWEPLVDPTTFGEVQRILADPRRKTARPGRGVHLLSMIAVCDVCGGPLAGRSGDRGPEYTCHRGGHVRVDEAELDEVAEATILPYLNDPKVRAAEAAAEDTSEALAAARDEVASIMRELDDLADELGAGHISATLAARAEQGIRRRLDAATERRDALQQPYDVDRLYPPGSDWATMPLAAKRELARRLLTAERIGELRVMRRDPSAGPRRVPVSERVRWWPPLAGKVASQSTPEVC